MSETVFDHPALGTLTQIRGKRWVGQLHALDFPQFGWPVTLRIVFDDLDQNGRPVEPQLAKMAELMPYLDRLGRILIDGFWAEIHGEFGDSAWALGLEEFNSLQEERLQVSQPEDLARLFQPTRAHILRSYWDKDLLDIALLCDGTVDEEHGFVLLFDDGQLVGSGGIGEAGRYDRFNSRAGLAHKRGMDEAARQWNERHKQ